MNSKHAFLALSVFTLVSIAHGEREVFAPTKLAPTAIGTNLDLTGGNSAAPSSTASTEPLTVGGYTGVGNIAAGVYGATRGILLLGANPAAVTQGIGTIKMLYGARSTTDENVASIVALQGTSTTNDSTSGGSFTIDTRPTGGASLVRRFGIMSTGDIVAGQLDTGGYTTGTPPNDTTIRSTQVLGGTDVPGASLTIAAGSSTGSAAGGSLRFSTAPSGAAGATPNAVVERMRIDSAGDVYIGNGLTAASPTAGTIRGTSGSGTNIAGAGLVVAPGQGTGSGAGGPFRVLTAAAGTSGSSLNPLTERMRIDSAGNVGIGTTNPTALNSGKVVDVKNDSNAGTAADNMDLVVESVNRFATLGLISSDSHTAELRFGAQTNKNRGGLIYDSSNNSLAFRNNSLERMRIDSSGNVGIGTNTNLSTLTINGPIAPKGPTDVNAATYTVATTDSSLRFTTTNCTVTLPAAASFPGRILWLNTVTANSVTSNASNVIPLGSNTAGTAIFAATAGKFAMIQSNGTNWVTMMSN